MILCIGTTPTVQRTLSFDRLQLDEVNRAALIDEYASGKSVNVARVARLLGADVLATGFVGGDRGAFLQAELTREGIRHDFQAIAGQTRLCTTVIDRKGKTVTELVEEHAPANDDDWRAIQNKIAKLLKGSRRSKSAAGALTGGGPATAGPANFALSNTTHLGASARTSAGALTGGTHQTRPSDNQVSVVVLSGSLPPKGPSAFYQQVIERASAVGVKVVLDSRGEPLRRALGQTGFVIKLNHQELCETIGRSLSTDSAMKKAMRAIAPKEGGSVIVTMGKSGAVAWNDGVFWNIPTPKIKSLNPIGSGDSFAAGLAVAIERGLPPSEAYALASACGAANALHPRAGVVDPAEVERLVKSIRVTKWK